MSPLTFGKLLGWACLLSIAFTSRAHAEAIETFALPNGLRVVLQEDKRQPVVGVAMGYGDGSFHDPPHRAELAHLCEHLMMLAPAPHTGSTWERMRMIGAEQGASTYATDMFSYAELPKEHLETALWIESERMAFVIQAIDEQLLERTKKVIKCEWHERNPDHLVERDRLIETAVYGSDHPMFKYATREPDLGDIELDDVRWWMQHVLQPSNAVLSLVGDFDTQSARRLVERYFGPIAPAVAHAREALIAQTNHFSTRLVRDELLVWDRSLITVAWPVRELPVGDAYALDVAAALLEDELRSQLADTATLLDVRFEVTHGDGPSGLPSQVRTRWLCMIAAAGSFA